jgi:hypothetical protein
VAIESSMMEAGPACPIGHIHITQKRYYKLCTANGIISSSNVKWRLPVFISCIHVSFMLQQDMYDSLINTITDLASSA